MRNNDNLNQTLPEPKRPNFLPLGAQWLAGEGAGSWFLIENTEKYHVFEITRFSPKGKIECQGLFEIENSDKSLKLDEPYNFVHLSHCAFVHIEQYNKTFKLVRN